MRLNTHNVKWRVSLSNGETYYEGKGLFIEELGELSPWNKLLQYLKEKEVTITSLGLYTNDGKTFNLHSSGNNPKFNIFSKEDLPISYKMYRKLGIDLQGGSDNSLFTVAIAEYVDYELQLWVNDKNHSHCWTLLVKK